MPRLALASFLLAALALVNAAPAAVERIASLAPEVPTAAGPSTPLSTVALATDDRNGILWTGTSGATPQAQRGSLGAPIIGPQNVPLDLQNADFLAPPSTDSGSVPNAKWPFSMSHNRLQTGGWARQQNVGLLPAATEMAGVNMRLEAGAVRELHWHKTAEWAFVLKGHVQVSVVNAEGQDYLATVGPSDLWYFPAGVPHSLQATADDPSGAEFVLVFDTGSFSEDSTFSLTDWLAHVPKDVLAKNFQTDVNTFSSIPGKELYIFPNTPPSDAATAPTSPSGPAAQNYTFSMSQMPITSLSGGSVRIVDSSVFPISKTIAAAEVTIEPGAMRELHWHPTQDEWSYYIEGTGRMTLFAATAAARTFDYQAGDVGYVPASFGHYVENTGNTTLRFLEIFKADRFQDISLTQWLALTPPELVKAHLGLDDNTLAHLNRTKQVVVGPVSA